ncbi:MAG: hypothetical protein NWE92_09465 [Candidatus Bathyarchaeota archaeon]|nr:hypothetical protein [Candidatus Bathyarchaeota archaeon]
MVLVEGIEIKAEPIPIQQLVSAWKNLSSKPLPKIKALKLNDKDFNHILAHLHCPEDSIRELAEWGRVLSIGGTDACVFNADEGSDDAEYMILIRKKPYNTIEKIILHELGHIARGDL